MTDYPQRNLTGLVIGNFAYKNKTDQLRQGATVLLIQIHESFAIFKTMIKEKSITDNP